MRLLLMLCSLAVTAASHAQPGPPTITLQEAVTRARANEPNFAAASAAARTAALDRSIARSALLPSAIFHNQFLYTQPNGAQNQAGSIGTQSAPRFIANNTVHEYTSQGVVNETVGLAQLTAVSRAAAAAAVASAELEIARRGLVSTVVSLYYGQLAADAKRKVAERALSEANTFVVQTQQREAGREVAHADVVKAQLSQQQRQRDLADAFLAIQRTRLDLGVLLFADPTTPYVLTPASTSPPLPTRAEITAAAGSNNPELQSALASLRGTSLDITAARAAYLPDLALNFTYGIDSPQYATTGPDNVRNLGYSAFATVDIPLWDWFATAHRVKQAQILRDAAQTALSATQRRLIADLEEAYAEAATARDQIDSLDLSSGTAAESLRLTRLRYTAGEATVLEVVDAQNSLTLAETAREDGIVRYETALASLQLLTGTF